MDAAQAHARELAPDRLGDALAERGLTHAGRTHEAEDGTLAGGIQFPYREIFEDPFLDLLEPVVVLVENAARPGDVDRARGVRLPGQFHHPVKVGADHRILARALGRAGEALQFLARLLFHVLGHFRRDDRFLEFGDFRSTLFTFAELLLDRAQLLAQQVLAVPVVDRLLRALVDLARDLEHFDAVRQQVKELIEARLKVERLEQLLLFFRADVHQAGDEIREPRGTLDSSQRGQHVLRDLRQELQDLDGTLLEIESASLDVRIELALRLDEFHARNCIRIALEELQDAKALHALANRIVRAVGSGHVAQHVGRGADPVQIVGTGQVDVGFALQEDAERTLQARGFLRGGARAFAAYRQREHDPGEQHDLAHGHDDERIVRERTRRGLMPRRRLGTSRCYACARIGTERIVIGNAVFVHICPVLLNLSIKQPSLNSCVIVSSATCDNRICRSKHP